MSIEHICLLVVLNLLSGTFMAWQKRRQRASGGNFVLLATILVGFAMMWRSLT